MNNSTVDLEKQQKTITITSDPIAKQNPTKRITEICKEIVNNITLNNCEYTETYLPVYHKETPQNSVKNNKINEINNLDSLV
jgi:hypothetical protein